MIPKPTEELFDVLDSSGEPTGQVCARSIVHMHGYFHATTHIWILNNNHELLLQKRSSTKDIHPGLWDISCAGHLNAGDTPLEAAVRECREELGLAIKPSELRFLFRIFQSYVSSDNSIRDNEYASVYLFRTTDKLPVGFSRDEIDDIKYVDIHTLRSMVDNADPDLVPHPEEYRRLFKVIILRQVEK